MAAITDTVRRIVPSTWRALVGVTQSGMVLYSTSDVQALADYVKFRLFSTVVAAGAESSFYDPRVVGFLGKVTTLQFLPAAIDFWGTQLESKQTTGTNESLTYRDNIESLWRLFDELTAEVAKEADDLGFTILGVKGLIPRVSYGDNGRGILITPDPQDFPAAYLSEPWTDLLPWSVNSG